MLSETSLACPDRFFPFFLCGGIATKKKRKNRSGHARLARKSDKVRNQDKFSMKKISTPGQCYESRQLAIAPRFCEVIKPFQPLNCYRSFSVGAYTITCCAEERPGHARLLRYLSLLGRFSRRAVLLRPRPSILSTASIISYGHINQLKSR